MLPSSKPTVGQSIPAVTLPRPLTLLLMVWFAVAVASCASAGGSSGTPGSSHNDALISQSEIDNSHQPTLFDVVQALRPTWLRQAPMKVRSGDDEGVIVYLDDQRVGSSDVLRQFPSTSALSLRFFTPSEAQSRFGLGNLHGVIQIASSKGRR